MGAPLCLDLQQLVFPISLHGFHILGVLIAKHISNSHCGAITNRGAML